MKSDPAREAFLHNVRQALTAGRRAGTEPEIEPRGRLGETDSVGDPTARFCHQFAKAGGASCVVTDKAGAVSRVLETLGAKPTGKILLSQATIIERLELASRLRASGLAVAAVEQLGPEAARESFFDSAVGITGVQYLISETATIVLMTGVEQPRSPSLLPPVHIAIAEEKQILPDLFDVFSTGEWRAQGRLPSCVTLITGPSKTGDIELRLVTGVHGPGEIHVVIVRE